MIIQELKKIAGRVGRVVYKIPNVSAVAIYGSLAQGYADKYSDINLIAICSKIPEPEQRKEYLKRNVKWIIFKNDIVPKWRTRAQDFFFANGKNISVIYKKHKVLSQVADEIGAGAHMSREIFREAVSYIYNTQIIKDPNKIFAALRKKIPSPTPQLLKYFLPSLEHVSLKNCWPYVDFKQALERQNYLYIDNVINIQIENFLICLFAINNKYYTSPKWINKSVRELKLKPRASLRRIQEISKLGNTPSDLRKKIRLVQSLVSDLNQLIIKEHIFNL